MAPMRQFGKCQASQQKALFFFWRKGCVDLHFNVGGEIVILKPRRIPFEQQNNFQASTVKGALD